jgi:hypothetical protein
LTLPLHHESCARRSTWCLRGPRAHWQRRDERLRPRRASAAS